MSIVINNTTINSRLTIVFDAAAKKDPITGEIISNDGPAFGSGNTESDVYIDNKTYLNIRSHTEIPSNVHALQCWNKNGTWTYSLEYTNNDPNHSYDSQADLPTWVNNVVIRCEAQDVWQNTYNSNLASQLSSWVDGGNATEDFVANSSSASSVADTARNNYLSGNSITY